MDADTVLIGQAAIEYQQKLDAEQRERAGQHAVPANVGSGVPGATLPGQSPVASKSEATTAPTEATAAVAPPNRFFGLVEVGATTATMDVSTIVNEVIQYFAAQSGVNVTVEIEARTRDGFEAGLLRTIKENGGVLKFRSANFEQE